MHPVRGFTLLEVLVAVALSAVLSVMAYSALTSSFNAAERLEITAQRINEVDQALQLLERDLTQFVDRSVATNLEDEAALIGEGYVDIEPYVRFTRQGWLNPLHRPRSNLQRVEYRHTQGALWRLYWPTLSQTTITEPQALELFNGVEEMRIRFLDRDTGGETSTFGGSWREQWNQPGILPVALELTLQLEDMGEIRRLFPLPAGIGNDS